jgi:hypothetical protein
MSTVDPAALSDTPDGQLLDELLTRAKLYTRTADYWELLKFVARMPHLAPFNVMLLHLQKPGIRYAASEKEWLKRFGRTVREGARPLLILWPFAPVAFVYDLQDTEGPPLPDAVNPFRAIGPVTDAEYAAMVKQLAKIQIEVLPQDAGDGSAGYIRVVRRAISSKAYSHYRILVNRDHLAPVRFATLAHELAHLYLGHLGGDAKLHVPDRRGLSDQQAELEAESVSYLVCARRGVANASEAYLATYVSTHTTAADLHLYQVMRAAGQVELALNKPARNKPQKPADQLSLGLD